MSSRGYEPRSTTARGYGWEHQQARREALAQMPDGAPCPFCQRGMSKDMRLDYDHYPPLAAGPGLARVRRLSHASCNRRAGQAIARGATRVVNSQAW